MIILQNEDKIYSKKTREYFAEVVSDYSNGNYRSAVVMLYSVTVCDLLFKLQELSEVYRDEKAKKILDRVDNNRTAKSGISKSAWEKELIDEIHEKTELLDEQTYTEIMHLRDQRNFSAHPALDNDYVLVAPSKETTIAHITNVLNYLLVKPPVFAKNIVDFLSEDIAEKKEIYLGQEKKFDEYINSKFIKKMTEPMKINVFKAFWKFCFCMPHDSKCMDNIEINRRILELLIEDNKNLCDEIQSDEYYKSISPDKKCCYNFRILLSKYPFVYGKISEDIKTCIEHDCDDDDSRAIAWYKFANKTEHINYMKTTYAYGISDKKTLEYMGKAYRDEGLGDAFNEYCIDAYLKSWSFDQADRRYDYFIEPNLDYFDKNQFEKLLNGMNTNDQIYNRGRAYSTNGIIIRKAYPLMGDDYDFGQYAKLAYDQGVLDY